MNRQEKLIVALLVAVLVGWMFFQNREQAARAARMRAEATNDVAKVEARGLSPEAAPVVAAPEAVTPMTPEPVVEAGSGVPETLSVLSNGLVRIELTSKGGGVKSTELLAYPRFLEDKTGARVVLDFAPHPALTFEGLSGFGPATDFVLDAAADQRSATIRAQRADGLQLVRTVAFTNGYRLAVTDRFTNASATALDVMAHRIGLGSMRSDIDLDDTSLAVDARATVKGKATYPELSKTRGFNRLFGASGGGCSGAKLPFAAPLRAETILTNELAWAAVRTRFFVQVLTPGETAVDLRAYARRGEAAPGVFRLEEVGLGVGLRPFALAPGGSVERTYDYYVGPREMSALRGLGQGQARLMRFGTWRIFCEWLLDLLNLLDRGTRNYGVAIILLTALVRLALLPVTKRSAEGMRRMQAMQPKLKEVQALYKDDPQKLQRETMRLYGEYKVNPLSSCLPMFIQLPVFVALFTVLRSAVELRFAPFLWVADLSAPENLFRETLGFGLNLLPILMAGTMALQSYLTPTGGDPSQQRMMMIMMPIMMLFMFYSFPAALNLYWTTSQILAIFGLLWQRRKNAAAAQAAGGVEVIPPPRETRQMRRARDR